MKDAAVTLRKSRERFPELDLIKGIGVIFIFIVHFSQMFPKVPGLLHRAMMFGQTGCQAFFLVSGFLMAKSFVEHPPKKLLPWYLKRGAAILPGYWIMILFYQLLSLLLRSAPSPFAVDSRFASVLFNIIPLNGLLPFCCNNVVPGGWYIGTLVLMYLVFPFVIKGITAFRNRKKSSVLFCLISCAAALLGAVVFRITAPELLGNNQFYFFNILSQFPSLLTGVCLYFGQERLKTLPVKKSVLGACISFAVTILLFLLSNGILITLVPVTAAVFWTFVLLLLQRFLAKENENPHRWTVLLESLGKNSYGFYLTHFLFAWFVPYYFRKAVTLNDSLAFLLLLIPCFLIACVIGSGMNTLLSRISGRLKGGNSK